jgi:tRNA threonylcarbamoyladenosine biosynthesis protein TsaB
MVILSIDTATSCGGVAVYDDSTGGLSECRVGGVKRQYSENIMEMTDLCLRNMSLNLDNIDCLAVTSGPGSFTGLRVGLSTVKGLAYATGKPVVAVSTLVAHAWMFPYYDGYVCPVLDARKHEVYSAIFEWKNDDFAPILDQGVYQIEDVLRQVRKPTIFLGDGMRVYREEIEKSVGDEARFAPWNMTGGLPSAVARLGALKAKRGEYADAASLSPEYFRKSEAEMKTAGKQL